MNVEQSLRDISAVRSMMERSSRYRSLSGMAGVLAGVYALVACYFVVEVVHFAPPYLSNDPSTLIKVCVVAAFALVLAVGSAIVLSARNAAARGEKPWGYAARQFAGHMAVPLLVGGIFSLALLLQGLAAFAIPVTLIFYGLAFYTASRFTFTEIRLMGMVQIVLGLLGTCFTHYAIWFWAAGFGVVNIIFGIHLHLKYSR